MLTLRLTVKILGGDIPPPFSDAEKYEAINRFLGDRILAAQRQIEQLERALEIKTVCLKAWAGQGK